MRVPVESKHPLISLAINAYAVVASGEATGFGQLSQLRDCNCGYYNHPEKECVCAPKMVKNI
jgi:magnesium chelatase family protein